MSGKSVVSGLGWAASLVAIILGAWLVLSPSSIFRLHLVGSGVLKAGSTLALPWAWIGAFSTIPLFYILLLGWVLGLFVAIGAFSRRRKAKKTELGDELNQTRKSQDRQNKSHVRALTAVLSVSMIVLAVSGMTIFLVPPTTSNPGQGHGPGGQGNGGSGGGRGGGQPGATSISLT